MNLTCSTCGQTWPTTTTDPAAVARTSRPSWNDDRAAEHNRALRAENAALRRELHALEDRLARYRWLDEARDWAWQQPGVSTWQAAPEVRA